VDIALYVAPGRRRDHFGSPSDHIPRCLDALDEFREAERIALPQVAEKVQTRRRHGSLPRLLGGRDGARMLGEQGQEVIDDAIRGRRIGALAHDAQ